MRKITRTERNSEAGFHDKALLAVVWIPLRLSRSLRSILIPEGYAQ
jgi:hypothetical protein